VQHKYIITQKEYIILEFNHGKAKFSYGGVKMAEFRAYVKDNEVMYDGLDDKVEMFSQFLDEMEEATDATSCECSGNDKVKDVVQSYFPDYADEIMDMFEDNGGYCDCEIGSNLMNQNSIIKKLGRYMDMQEI